MTEKESDSSLTESFGADVLVASLSDCSLLNLQGPPWQPALTLRVRFKQCKCLSSNCDYIYMDVMKGSGICISTHRNKPLNGAESRYLAPAFPSKPNQSVCKPQLFRCVNHCGAAVTQLRVAEQEEATLWNETVLVGSYSCIDFWSCRTMWNI